MKIMSSIYAHVHNQLHCIQWSTKGDVYYNVQAALFHTTKVKCTI